MRFHKTDFLSHVFLFEALSREELSSLASLACEVRLKKGEPLFDEGQFVDGFYILAFGRIKIFRLSPTGDENIIHLQKDGDLIAEAAIFDDERYPANGISLEDSLLVKIPSQPFKKLLEKNSSLCFKIMSAYAKRLRLLAKKIQELTVNDMKGRLATYLREHQYKNSVELTLTKKELASSLGTIPETLSRAFHFFKKEGIIDVKRNVITIKDGEALDKFIGAI